jgi:hypothetical protein
MGLAASVLPVRRVLASVPTWTWVALGIALAGLLGAWWHHGQVKRHDTAVIAARDAQWNKRLDAEHAAALNWKAKFDAATIKLSAAIREKNDAEAARINVARDDLLRDGPGKARCGQVDYPYAATRSGGPQPPIGGGGAATASLPPADGIAAVPWNWLVNTGGKCDLNRSEAQSWRDWYAQLVKTWPKP